MNKALQLKLIWKLSKNKDSKWVDLTRAKYQKDKSLVQYKKGKNCSWQWSKLMDLRGLFAKGIRWQIGKGNKVKLWKDKWVYHNSLVEMGLDLGQGSLFDEEITVDKFINRHNQ